MWFLGSNYLLDHRFSMRYTQYVYILIGKLQKCKINSLTRYEISEKSKNAKLIPWLDMKILENSKNAKLIPWLDLKIVKNPKSQN